MGFSGIGIGSLVLILLIVIVLFGTKRIRSIGSDLGAALSSFRKGMKEVEATADDINAGNTTESLSPEQETASSEKSKAKRAG